MTALRASTRISIRWLPDPASEPTDTLVLSVGEYFVDLRVLTADKSIDWALAGERIVLSEDPLKVKFDHRLSSQASQGGEEEQAADVGTFSKLPNGDDLETGEMAAPHLGGKITPYEEVWRPLDFGMRDSAYSRAVPLAWVLESVTDQGTGGTLSWYAKVGRFFLGVRRRRGDDGRMVYDAVRQDWDDEEGRWSTKYSIGSQDGLWKVGDLGPEDELWGNIRTEAVVTLATGETCIVRAVG